MMHLRVTVPVLVILGLFLAGCIETVYNVQNVPVTKFSNRSLSLDEVKEAIMRSSGTSSVHYKMQDVEPGLIRCELNFKSKHKAWVDIPYSEDSYSILYQKSVNLRYSPPSEEGSETIKRHYNKWIRDLDESIKRNLGSIPSKSK
jgi:hypothetical protein